MKKLFLAILFNYFLKNSAYCNQICKGETDKDKNVAKKICAEFTEAMGFLYVNSESTLIDIGITDNTYFRLKNNKVEAQKYCTKILNIHKNITGSTATLLFSIIIEGRLQNVIKAVYETSLFNDPKVVITFEDF